MKNTTKPRNRILMMAVAALLTRCAGPASPNDATPSDTADDRTRTDDGAVDSADGIGVDSSMDAGVDGGADVVGDAAHDAPLADRPADGPADGAPDCSGPFTIDHQQPPDCLPYPGSLWNRRLPSSVMSHLMTNSNAIVQNTMTDHGTFSYPWARAQALSVVSTATAGGNDPDPPLYFGQSTDPYYVFSTCTATMTAGPHNAIGMPFHAPNGATDNFEGGDSFFAVWDQTTNLLFASYRSSPMWQQLPACPGGGHAGTAADPCPISTEYCGVSNWTTDPGFGIRGSGDSLESGGEALHDRGVEMIAGAIHHAQYLETDCTVGHVFPANSNTLQCTTGITDRPAEGSLFFLDYTPAQLADIRAHVPTWQYELLEALTLYGGYVGDTHGGAAGLFFSHFEGPAAYEHAAIPFPLGNWLLSFPHASSAVDQPLLCFARSVGQECEFNPYVSVPLETGPACPTTPCEVSQHLHVADPCVALALAGMPGGCP